MQTCGCMKNLNQLLKKVRKGIQDVVAVHFDFADVKCVRMRKTGDDVQVVAVDILPFVNLAVEDEQSSENEFSLPKKLITRYVSICVPGEKSIIRLLNLPGQHDEANIESHIQEHMGINVSEYRIGYRNIGQGHGRSETKLLVVAVLESEAYAACSLFPIGIPAPRSVEVAGMSAMNAFLKGPAKTYHDEAVGMIETGKKNTFAAFFYKGELLLARKFDFGTYDLLDKIQQTLGVDRETAQNIISDGSFNVSHTVKEVSEQFIKQLVISKTFVERRENCHVSRIFVPGGLGVSHDWLNEMKLALAVDTDFWNPFDSVSLPDDVFPKELEGQQSLFSAAIGAGIGTFEEESE